MNILFDVGACKGDFSHAWLAKNPGGKVYCVEPDSENAKNLRIRFKGMNVEVIEKAVWVENEKRPFWSGTTPENASLTVTSSAVSPPKLLTFTLKSIVSKHQFEGVEIAVTATSLELGD